MRRIATALLVAFGLAAPVAQAQIAVNTDWTNKPAYFGAGLERGAAYGTYAGTPSLLVVSRTGGISIRQHDAAAGNGGALLNTFNSAATLTGVTGGFFLLNDIALSSDGVVIACNLTLNAVTAPFKCYRWTDLAAAPTTVINFTDVVASRLGDTFTLTNNGSAYTLWAAASGSDRIIRFTSADAGLTWTSSVIATTSNPTATWGTVPSVAPLPDGSFYLKSAGRGAWLYNAAGVFQAQIPTTVIQSPATATRFFQATTGTGLRSYIASYQYNPSNISRIVVFDVTDGPATAIQVATSPAIGPTATANGNGTGDVEVLVNGDNTVTFFGLGTDNGIGRFTTTTALPVELVAFTAAADGTSALLRWATASETNNAGFTIEARANGAQMWSTLGQVAGAGTTLEASAYSFRTDALAAGRYTFRLRQTDFDGASSYSAEVEAEIGMASAAALGVRGARTVTFSVREAQAVTVGLYDALGRRVAVLFDGAVEAGAAHTAHVGDGLSAGVYFVRLEGARAQATRSLVVR